MAGPFKTGEELRKESVAKLMAQSQGKFATLAQTDPLIAGLGDFGSAIGAGLGARMAHGGEAGQAAGDIDLSSQDLGTSRGNFEAAETLRNAGFQQEADQLQDRGIKLYTHESKLAEADAAARKEADLTGVRPLTKIDVASVNNGWLTRGDEVSEAVLEIQEEAADNPVAAAGLRYLNDSITRNVNEMTRDLEDIHNKSVPSQMLIDAFQEQLANENVFGDDGSFFFADPIVDTKAATKIINTVRQKVMASFAKKESTMKAEDKPVKTVPAQQTTGQAEEAVQAAPATPQGGFEPFDTQGSISRQPVPQATPLAPPANVSKSDRSRLEAINRSLQHILDTGRDEWDPAVQALMSSRDKILNKY